MGRADFDENDGCDLGVAELFEQHEYMHAQTDCVPLLQNDNAYSQYNPYQDPDVTPPPFSQLRSPRSTAWNNFCRWVENAKFFGAGVRVFLNIRQAKNLTTVNQSSAIDYTVLVGNLAGVGSGLGLAVALHCVFCNSYPPQDQNKPTANPLRAFKTLASLATSVGSLIASLLQYKFPAGTFKLFNAIFADLAVVAVGILILPFTLFKKKSADATANGQNEFGKVGLEDWSKYAKTALVFGISLGQVMGGIFSFITHASMTLSLAIGGGIFSIVCFVSSVIGIPLINKYTNGRFIAKDNDKDWLRNNYLRTAITLGLAIGSTVGFFLGTFVFTALGPVAAMTIGGATCSIVLAPVFGKYGKRISTYIQENWKIHPDTDNSWDYATRNTSYACSFLFSAIGFFLPIPGGAIIGAALGSAVGGIVGWFAGLLIIKLARVINEKEKPANTIPWTQRMGNGANVFSFVGSLVGFGIGMLLGPLGPLAGATIGFAIGGFFGSVVGAVFDPAAKPVTVETKSLPETAIEPKAEIVHINSLLPSPKPRSITVETQCEKIPLNKTELQIQVMSDTIENKYLSRTTSSPLNILPSNSPNFFRAKTVVDDSESTPKAADESILSTGLNPVYTS